MALEKPYMDIPGTIVFDSDVARRGYWINRFCKSLMDAGNRDRFRADERAYLDEWPLAEEQKKALLDRDYNRVLELGGNVYFFSKLFFTDEQSFEQAASAMTGMPREKYREMMLNGGRSPDGNRFKKEWEGG